MPNTKNASGVAQGVGSGASKKKKKKEKSIVYLHSSKQSETELRT
jgi:hypothetical protein